MEKKFLGFAYQKYEPKLLISPKTTSVLEPQFFPPPLHEMHAIDHRKRQKEKPYHNVRDWV
jgi:hypothetical protein